MGGEREKKKKRIMRAGEMKFDSTVLLLGPCAGERLEKRRNSKQNTNV